MPIYAYRCSTCNHTQDMLQKLSDAPLTECPSCHAQTFNKQLSAPSIGGQTGGDFSMGDCGGCAMGGMGGPCG